MGVDGDGFTGHVAGDDFWQGEPLLCNGLIDG
jgi:hypothetical protein